MKFFYSLFFTTSLVILTSCASKARNFKLSMVKKDEGIAIGKITLQYNGAFNDRCIICFNSVNGPCQYITKEGYIFLNIKQGPAHIVRVMCKDFSTYHYNIKEAHFTQSDGITYFGDISLDWKNDGGLKVSDFFGAAGIAASQDINYGTLKMNIQEGNPKDVIQAFKKQVGKEKLEKVTKSIMRVKN